MKEEVNLQQLTLLLAKHADISTQDAETFLKEFFTTIPNILLNEDLLEIKDFGTFTLTQVSTKEAALNAKENNTPTWLKLRFSPAEELKNRINKPFSHFECVLLNKDVSFDNLTKVTENEEDETSEDILIEIGHENIPEEISVAPAEKTEKLPETFEEKETTTTTTYEKTAMEKAENTGLEKHKKKKRKPIARWMPILGTVAVAAVLIFFFVSEQRKQQALKNNPEKVTTKTTETKTSQANLTIPTDSFQQTTETPEENEKVKLSAGKTLRTIALEKFGNREFWVYIYYKNKDRIKNPNIIPEGIELTIPNESEYDIDASNPQSITKAKLLGDIELKKFR
ncbi:MAG TPA: HU family DNA-binding protein [Dysgonamonadaceae bacterium]|nr:HU family DNA-binding protein [Dysgonamonadaceae bacterium]